MIGTLNVRRYGGDTRIAHTCEGLKTISLPNTTITTSVLVPEGVFTPATAPRGTGATRRRAALKLRSVEAEASARRTPPQPIIAPAHCRVVAVLQAARLTP